MTVGVLGEGEEEKEAGPRHHTQDNGPRQQLEREDEGDCWWLVGSSQIRLLRVGKKGREGGRKEGIFFFSICFRNLTSVLSISVILTHSHTHSHNNYLTHSRAAMQGAEYRL